jgi:hypothetical protein
MPLTPKMFYQGTLGVSSLLLKTIPPGQIAEIKQISMVNRGAVNAHVFLNFVIPGESASITNFFLYDFVIEPSEHIEYGTWQILESAGTIYGYSTGALVNIRISGMLSL